MEVVTGWVLLKVTICTRSAEKIPSRAAIVPPSLGALVRGVPVLQHRHVPLSLFRSLRPIPTLALTPIILRLIFSDLFYVGFFPKTHSDTTHKLGFGGWNFLLVYPTVQCVVSDSQKLRDLNRRISFHL